jgi:hypothetical protein
MVAAQVHVQCLPDKLLANAGRGLFENEPILCATSIPPMFCIVNGI